jgi:peptide chain release factor 1
MSRLPLEKIIQDYNQTNQKLSTTANTKDLIELSKRQKKLQAQYDLAVKIQTLETSITENRELLLVLGNEDAEMKELTELDVQEKELELTACEDKLLSFLAPTDPRDEGDAILEIRAGAGGDESALFAANLLRSYTYMADKLGLKIKVISQSLNDLGGYKEVIAEIRGEGAYSWFKYEGGVHRVQRVPETEKQGRIHTSTVSIAIMPLIEENDTQFKLDPKDIEIQTTMAGGNGGQSVNTTYSAVRMRHIPTGLEAQSQDQKNQIQNRIKCLQVLTSRVFDLYETERLQKEAAERKGQVGRMDRSEKIRTYNFPQDRMTDHRYNKSWNQLPLIMNGDIVSAIEDIKKLEAEQVLKDLV